MVRARSFLLLGVALGMLSCQDANVTEPGASAVVSQSAAPGHSAPAMGTANGNSNGNGHGNGKSGGVPVGKPDAGSASADDDLYEELDLDAVARYTSPRAGNGVQRASAQIGPQGGSVRLHDFEVVVPAGAVDREMRFEIRILPEQGRNGHAWASFSPHNHEFAVPVTLRVPLRSTESAAAPDAHVLWWNRGEWVELPTTVTPDGRLETQTDHFSKYGTQRRGITMVGG